MANEKILKLVLLLQHKHPLKSVGGLAQLAERVLCMADVGDSNSSFSNFFTITHVCTRLEHHFPPIFIDFGGGAKHLQSSFENSHTQNYSSQIILFIHIVLSTFTINSSHYFYF
jgi:hypothetical protein